MTSLRERFEDFVDEESRMKACETVSPNSPEYDSLCEWLTQHRPWRLALAKEWRRRQRRCANDTIYTQEAAPA